tara:strand:- start:123 stop:344 length:222 start_codon:yes stop_codon:yes gene_type:complete
MTAAEENDQHQEVTVEPDELQRLKAEHAHLKEKISTLEELRFPSDREESQIKQLKKEKLSVKEKLTKLQFKNS